MNSDISSSVSQWRVEVVRSDTIRGDLLRKNLFLSASQFFPHVSKRASGFAERRMRNPTTRETPIGRGKMQFQAAAGHRRGPGAASFTEVDMDEDP